MKALMYAFSIIILVAIFVFGPFIIISDVRAKNHVELEFISSEIAKSESSDLYIKQQTSSLNDFCTWVYREFKIPEETAKDMYFDINSYNVVYVKFRIHNNSGFAMLLNSSFSDQQNVYVKDWYPIAVTNFIEKGISDWTLKLCYKGDGSIVLDETLLGIEYNLIFDYKKHLFKNNH